MNENKFTPRAEEALRLSQEAAGELGHGYVGTEHLLLGILREEDRGAMAKGILCSLVCVFTVMPTLILWCDGLLKKTNKAYLRQKIQARKEGKKNA